MSSRKAALFDVDRTLLRGDTATLFAGYRYRTGNADLSELLQVALWLLEYRLGIVEPSKVAEKALRKFRGMREARLVELCELWYALDVRPLISGVGRERVIEHQRAGDVVALVTGTTRYAAVPLARDLEIQEVVCSELEVDDEGVFTGAIREPLCYGPGKLARAEAWAASLGLRLEDAAFYSDSVTDLPLLERTRAPVAVNPDLRLWAVAKRRGWAVERW